MTHPVTQSTQRNPTADELALARKIAAEHRGTGWDRYDECALLAIMETTDRAKALMAKERLYREQGEATAKANKQRQEARDCQTMKIAFAQAGCALERGDHLKQEPRDDA